MAMTVEWGGNGGVIGKGVEEEGVRGSGRIRRPLRGVGAGEVSEESTMTRRMPKGLSHVASVWQGEVRKDRSIFDLRHFPEESAFFRGIRLRFFNDPVESCIEV
jgi:hypothetical protein